jgi:hypothetical protein
MATAAAYPARVEAELDLGGREPGGSASTPPAPQRTQ